MKLIIKQLNLVVYVILRKNRDCFYKTGGLIKNSFSENVSCPSCNIVINRSSLNKYKKGH